MIRIDVSKIKNWELIKKKHSEWYNTGVFSKVKEAYNFLKGLSLNHNLEYPIKKYIELLEKIINKGKDFVIIDELFLDYTPFGIEKLVKIMRKNRESKSILEMSFESLKLPDKYLPYTLFSYDKFPNYTGKWNRHKLLSLMEIEVCPYCQRNYISSFEENDDKRTTADLDHFYPKSLYPFLALSLYNFIPSCQVCNSRFKGSKDTYGSVYLHKEGFEELGVKFETSKEIINVILGEKKEFSINFNYKNLIKNKEIEKSIKNLGLDKIYKESHNKYVKNTLEIIKKYPESYTKILDEFFIKKEIENKRIKSFFEEIIKEPYRKRIENGEPLAKLTKDILEEFDIKI